MPHLICGIPLAVRQWIRKYAVFNLVCHISIFSFGAKVQKNPHNHGDYADNYLFVSIFTSPPRIRHSLIYNYLREHAVLMLQNAYKHPCSKHLTTNGKGTHFFQNRDKKTNINASE
jgi:hypothetical protein